jgi:HlyD family secretion protein
MSATVDIETQTVRNVVAVPVQSVTVRSEGGLSSDEFQKQQAKQAENKSGNISTSDSDRENALRNRELLQRVVFVREGDKVTLRRVETGIADDTWIEIKRGVQPGEQVVSGSYAAISRKLKDGSIVRTDRPKKDDAQN